MEQLDAKHLEARKVLNTSIDYNQRGKKWEMFYALYSGCDDRSEIFNLENIDQTKKQQKSSISAKEANAETKNKCVTIKEMTEMPLTEASAISRRLAAKYLSDNSSDYSLEELLAVIRYIESGEPVLKGFTFKLAELADEGKQDSKEYEIWEQRWHDVLCHFNENVEKNALQLYLNYIIWLYYKKQEHKAKRNL